jgi:hypothetical protein
MASNHIGYPYNTISYIVTMGYIMNFIVMGTITVIENILYITNNRLMYNKSNQLISKSP